MTTSTFEPVHTVTVSASEWPAEGVLALTLARPDGGELPAWEPGAHIDLLLADDLERQYSLCGDPADRRSWRVAILRESAGRGGSVFVHDRLVPGEQLRVRGPRNHFKLEPAQRYLFVAGGIGITPILPMIQAATRASIPWRLLYGGRTTNSMAFAEALAARGSQVQIRPQDQYGLLDLKTFLGRPQPGTLVYSCGPEPLLQAMEEATADWPEGTLHTERFTAKAISEEERANEREFDVVLARSGHTLRIKPGCSILDAVEGVGIEATFSCREGTCGTCEIQVMEGSPEHRDSVLTNDEREAGDAVLICVSRSLSPRLVLDL